MTRFLSDLGGISGLYVGITMYTLAEIVDVITQFLCVYLPHVWAAAKLGVKKQLAKHPTNEDKETQLTESHTEQVFTETTSS